MTSDLSDRIKGILSAEEVQKTLELIRSIPQVPVAQPSHFSPLEHDQLDFYGKRAREERNKHLKHQYGNS